MFRKHSPFRLALAAILLLPPMLPAEELRPTIWVCSDMSDPRDQRSGGHPFNDPDDICSMAALLLEANRFEIAGIVFSSTNRQNLPDATEFVESTFVEAYRQAREPLNAALGGFPEEIPFIRSSITGGAEAGRFDPERDYTDLSALATVRGLVEVASREPVYVLNWGPLTESAMAVKHCIDTGNTKALENITILSHWTRSFIAQGTPEAPEKVANCRDDARACAWLHELAAEGILKFIELGSVGQTGIVNGSDGYPRADSFRHSRLGQVFIHSKFYHGKPDQSDASTFWLLGGAFGPDLESYPADGRLTRADEERVRDLFLKNGPAILDDLLLRSEIASRGGEPFPGSFIAARFTYVYQYLNGRYYIYLPYHAEVSIRDALGELFLEDSYGAGNHELDFSMAAPSTYTVTVRTGGLERTFSLVKNP